MLTRQMGNQSQGLATGPAQAAVGSDEGCGCKWGGGAMTGWGSCLGPAGLDPLVVPNALYPPHSRGKVPRAAKAPGWAVDLTPLAAEF